MASGWRPIYTQVKPDVSYQTHSRYSKGLVLLTNLIYLIKQPKPVRTQIKFESTHFVRCSWSNGVKSREITLTSRPIQNAVPRSLARLPNVLQQRLEPRNLGVEVLPPLDPLELDRPDRRALLVLVLPHAPRHSRDRALHPLLGAAPDHLPVEGVRRRAPGEVPRLLHQRLLRPHERRQPLREVRPRVDLRQAHVPERVPRHFLPGRLQLRHDVLHARALTQEHVDAPVRVHDRLEALALRGNVNLELRDPHGVHVARRGRGGETRAAEAGGLEALAVLARRGRGQVSRVAPHDLVDDEHARVGRGLRDDIGEEEGPLLGGSVGAEGLDDGEDIVVNGLGHAHHYDLTAVLFQDVLGQLGGLSVSVVAADGVEDTDLVLQELLGGDLERGLAVLDEAASLAVLDVGEL